MEKEKEKVDKEKEKTMVPKQGEMVPKQSEMIPKQGGIIPRREVKMYLLVNMDLGMGKGKIAGQVGHAVSGLIRRLMASKQPEENYQEWINNHEPKIVLKASEAVLHKVMEDLVPDDFVAIYDLGLTQINPFSLTVVGLVPLRSNQVPPLVASLKLL